MCRQFVSYVCLLSRQAFYFHPASVCQQIPVLLFTGCVYASPTGGIMKILQVPSDHRLNDFSEVSSMHCTLRSSQTLLGTHPGLSNPIVSTETALAELSSIIHSESKQDKMDCSRKLCFPLGLHKTGVQLIFNSAMM